MFHSAIPSFCFVAIVCLRWHRKLKYQKDCFNSQQPLQKTMPEPVFTEAEQIELDRLNDKMDLDPEYLCRMTRSEFAVYKKYIIENFGVYDNFMADFDYESFIAWAKRVCADSDDEANETDDNFRMIKRPDAIPPNGREDPNSDCRRSQRSTAIIQ